MLWSYSVAQSHRSVDQAAEPHLQTSSQKIKPSVSPQSTIAPASEPAPKPHLQTSSQKIKPSASPQSTIAPASEPAPKPHLQTSSKKIKPTAPPFPLKRALLKSESPEKRCRGCLCVNPCSNLKYCLTPQTDLEKRVRVSKQTE